MGYIISNKRLLHAVPVHSLVAIGTPYELAFFLFLLSSKSIALAMLRTAGIQFFRVVALASSWLTGPLMNLANLIPLRKVCVQPGNDILESTGFQTVAVFLS